MLPLVRGFRLSFSHFWWQCKGVKLEQRTCVLLNELTCHLTLRCRLLFVFFMWKELVFLCGWSWHRIRHLFLRFRFHCLSAVYFEVVYFKNYTVKCDMWGVTGQLDSSTININWDTSRVSKLTSLAFTICDLIFF